MLPAHGSEFAKQSHAELKAETLKFVGNLREWLSMHSAQDAQKQHQQWTAMNQLTDEAQRKQLWDALTRDLIQSSTALNDEYASRFKIKAIVLRDELLTRVQRPDPKTNWNARYEQPTNAIVMGMIADDLERLARLLC